MAMTLDTAIKFTAKLEGQGLDQLKRNLQGLSQQSNVSKRSLDQLYTATKALGGASNNTIAGLQKTASALRVLRDQARSLPEYSFAQRLGPQGALFSGTDEIKQQIVGIVIGSTMKGLLVGVLTGWYAARVSSMAKGLAVGGVIAAIFAFAIAAFPQPDGSHYWIAIMVPGTIVGLLVGYATQKYGTRAAPR